MGLLDAPPPMWWCGVRWGLREGRLSRSARKWLSFGAAPRTGMWLVGLRPLPGAPHNPWKSGDLECRGDVWNHKKPKGRQGGNSCF